MFDPQRAVEIRRPKYGSGYRIGGRLVITAKHLFENETCACRVRSKHNGSTTDFEEVDAQVIWQSPTADIALVLLPEGIPEVSQCQFDVIAKSSYLTGVMYGYPRWGWTTKEDKNFPGGRKIPWKHYSGDTSPEGLFLIEPERFPDPHPEVEGHSLWEGVSGASLFYKNKLVAVLKQHQRPDQQKALEAEPLANVFEDASFQATLEELGYKFETKKTSISVEPKEKNVLLGEIKNFISQALSEDSAEFVLEAIQTVLKRDYRVMPADVASAECVAGKLVELCTANHSAYQVINQVLSQSINLFKKPSRLRSHLDQSEFATEDTTCAHFIEVLERLMLIDVCGFEQTADIYERRSNDFLKFNVHVSTLLGVEMVSARQVNRKLEIDGKQQDKRGRGGLVYHPERYFGDNPDEVAKVILWDLWNHIFPNPSDLNRLKPLEEFQPLNQIQESRLSEQIMANLDSKKTHYYFAIAWQENVDFDAISEVLCSLVPNLMVVSFGGENKLFLSRENQLASAVHNFYQDMLNVFPEVML